MSTEQGSPDLGRLIERLRGEANWTSAAKGTTVDLKAILLEAADSLAALQGGERPPPLRDPKTFKHRYEDAGVAVVAAIERDYLQAMDDNDGGEILGWILKLCDCVHSDYVVREAQLISDVNHARERQVALEIRATEAESAVESLRQEKAQLTEENARQQARYIEMTGSATKLEQTVLALQADSANDARVIKARGETIAALEQTVRTLAEVLNDALTVTRNYYAQAISRFELEKHQEQWKAALSAVERSPQREGGAQTSKA